ncbi:hypothetical protein DFJ77DRAFT_454317 [Powellomyces hirtus]|nr:hypothetical protein DFJ77DRAFT_454317 [Powellomyces hirtus]
MASLVLEFFLLLLIFAPLWKRLICELRCVQKRESWRFASKMLNVSFLLPKATQLNAGRLKGINGNLRKVCRQMTGQLNR